MTSSKSNDQGEKQLLCHHLCPVTVFHPIGSVVSVSPSISEAILITGGSSAYQSAEVFLPWQNSTCELPSLPDERWYHVQSGNTLCGGSYRSTRRSCVQWSVQHGGWVTLPLNLTEKRQDSSVWIVSQDNSLVIMGGAGSAGRTSETVSSDGDSTERTFKMKYPTKWAWEYMIVTDFIIINFLLLKYLFASIFLYSQTKLWQWIFLSSPGPKPLRPKTQRGLGLTLKSYGPPPPPHQLTTNTG